MKIEVKLSPEQKLQAQHIEALRAQIRQGDARIAAYIKAQNKPALVIKRAIKGWLVRLFN
jgi:hypothetical protein